MSTTRPSPAALRVLQVLAEAERPLTVAELTGILGGHLNTVRPQLAALREAGLVSATTVTSTGRGRPARAYQANIAGVRLAQQNAGRDDQAALLATVTDHLGSAPDPVTAAQAFGRGWGGRLEKAADQAELVTILAEQGFAPRAVAEGIELRSCPFLGAADDHQVLCGIHQGMLDAVSPEPLRLVPFAGPEGCLVVSQRVGR